MKGLTVTKNVKEIKFEGVWGELESKKGFQRQSYYKIFESNPSYHVKQHSTGKV